MAEINQLQKGSIRCPNHGCPLDGIPSPYPAKGTGMCPVSGANFSFEVKIDENTNEVVMDKDGNPTIVKTFNIKGNE